MNTENYNGPEGRRRLSHEMRNILTLIKGSLQLTEQNYPEIAGSKHWKYVFEDISALEKLTLILSDSGKGTLKLKPGNPTELVYEIAETFRPTAAASSVSLSIHTDDTASATDTLCSYDRDSIHRLLINLLKNALEASDKNTEILVCIGRQQKHQRIYYTVSVTNTGAVIAEEDIPLLFTENFTTKENGSGKGLFICDRIAKSHKGFITVSPQENKTTFTLYLPCI